jgi:hypothetical protein
MRNLSLALHLHLPSTYTDNTQHKILHIWKVKFIVFGLYAEQNSAYLVNMWNTQILLSRQI